MKQEWTIVAVTTVEVEVPVIGQKIPMDLEVGSTDGQQWDITFGCRMSDHGLDYWSDWTRAKSFFGTQVECMAVAMEFTRALHKAVERTVLGKLDACKFKFEDYVGRTAAEIRGGKASVHDRNSVEIRFETSRQQIYYLNLEIEEGVVTGRILNLRELL